MNHVPVIDEGAPETGDVRPDRSLRSRLKQFLREPLLHFLLIGLSLLGLYAYLNWGRTGIESSKQIVLSLDDLRIVETYFESQWHRQPTPQEFKAMVEDKVREEVRYREGLAMGLDKDDTIVQRRMAQKMQFLAEDVATAHEPTTAELKAWFNGNKEKFALPAATAFDIFTSLPTNAAAVRSKADIGFQPSSCRLRLLPSTICESKAEIMAGAKFFSEHAIVARER